MTEIGIIMIAAHPTRAKNGSKSNSFFIVLI
jgi:hypothetical protein